MPSKSESPVFREGSPTALEIQQSDAGNSRALAVMKRVMKKLDGREFQEDEALDVVKQVDKLIAQATSEENLAVCYRGWCPFW